MCTTDGHVIVKPETQFRQMNQLSPECWSGKLSPNERAEKNNLLESNASNRHASDMINEVIKEHFCDDYQYGMWYYFANISV